MNDLSDEAAEEFLENREPEPGKPIGSRGFMAGWQECRRRAQLLIRNLIHDFEEEERKAFDWAVLDTEGWDLSVCTEEGRKEIQRDLDLRWQAYKESKKG